MAVDTKAFFKIGYGLYVITASQDGRDNGMICNTVTQVTATPAQVAVTINKSNFTHDMIVATKRMNVSVLDETAPFEVFQRFGFHSGRTVNKFDGVEVSRSENGLPVLTKNVNGLISLEVTQMIDLGTHTLFICSVTEAKTLSSERTMTYDYYQTNVKPKPTATKKKGFVCTICGYVYEGETLPADFVCPICKHPASDFKPL